MSISIRPVGLRRIDYLIRNAQVLSIAGFAVLCLICFSLGSPYFLSSGNLLNLVRQSAAPHCCRGYDLRHHNRRD
jgi:simple sugar transport system permease protein